MNNAVLLPAVVLTPLAGVVGILLCRHHANLREAISLLTAALLFFLVLQILTVTAAGETLTWTLFAFLPGLSLTLHAEPLGIGFALIVAFLWPITVLYAIGYMRAHEEHNQTRFYLFFAVAIAATIGGAFAANLLTLYFFYEALTLATYPLVTHGGKAKDMAGGRTYLLVLLGTSLTFLLIAMVWTYSISGTLDFMPGGILSAGDELLPGLTPLTLAVLFALFLFGIGKAALMPFHLWLPAAMVAPTPVSALLHAVAVVKLGVFAILKITVYIFGIDTLTQFDASKVMQYVAAATLLIAAMIALREDNLKRRLAFSTISQLAYIVLAASLANTVAIAAGGMHVAVHAFAKITLFFCAGMILVSLHKTRVSELRGVGRRMPVTFSAWLIASLCIIGMPLTGGFWSKWYLVQGAWATGDLILVGTILLGSLLAVGYLLPPALLAFNKPSDDAAALADNKPRLEAPASSLLAICITAAMTVVLFFIAQPMIRFLQQIFAST
jgi:multicomponent Na+:H+ antiporter subunit D